MRSKKPEKLADAVVKVHNGQPIHCAFQISPSPWSRRWESCVAEPVSDWAFAQIMADLDRQVLLIDSTKALKDLLAVLTSAERCSKTKCTNSSGP